MRDNILQNHETLLQNNYKITFTISISVAKVINTAHNFHYFRHVDVIYIPMTHILLYLYIYICTLITCYLLLIAFDLHLVNKTLPKGNYYPRIDQNSVLQTKLQVIHMRAQYCMHGLDIPSISIFTETILQLSLFPGEKDVSLKTEVIQITCSQKV